jgi:hypothetical protein
MAQEKAGGMAEVVKYLSSRQEALSSNPVPTTTITK